MYSLHLEVFTGITGRLMQFVGASCCSCKGLPLCIRNFRVLKLETAAHTVLADVLQDARKAGQPAKQVVMGDLNTMAHRHVLQCHVTSTAHTVAEACATRRAQHCAAVAHVLLRQVPLVEYRKQRGAILGAQSV